LRAQGWEPGKFLGAQGAAHADLHTAASSAPIKVVLKDDTMGLGAKPRQKQNDECTGLNGFADLLGRLNGKSEDTIQKEQKARSELKTSLFVERRYGSMRFVSGGLLVGDQMQELVSTDPNTLKKEESEEPKFKLSSSEEPELLNKEKKDKKSKKRKAEDTETPEGSESSRDKKRKKKSKDEDSKTDDQLRDGKKSKKSKDKTEDEAGAEAIAVKSKKKEKKSKKSKDESDSTPQPGGESGDVTENTEESDKKRRKREKREKKEKKRKEQEATDSTGDSTPSIAATLAESGRSTPVESGTSTPQALANRNRVRARYVASKRLAMADMTALNQVSLY
jgi:Pin2-interacting protein X1